MDPPPPRPDPSREGSQAPGSGSAASAGAVRLAPAITVAVLVAVLLAVVQEGEAPERVAPPAWAGRVAGAGPGGASAPAASRAEPGFSWAVEATASQKSVPAGEDLCSSSPGGAAAADPDALSRRVTAASRRARERFVGSLVASTDDRQRILGLYLQRDAEIAAATLPAALMAETCGRDAACARRAAEAMAEATRSAAGPRTDAIARLASAGLDPAAYALAVEACAGATPPAAGACRLISAEQWTRLDPGNAVPWLHAAAAAAARRDPAAVAEALHQVAHARTNRFYGETVHELLSGAMPADLSAVERAQVLGATAWAVASAWTVPDPAPVLDFCSAGAVRDSNRMQACDALALQLIEKAGTLDDLRVGVRVAEQIGWPEANLEPSRRRHDAFARVRVEALAEARPRSCRDLIDAGEQVARQARLGEIGALQEAVGGSGKTVDQLAAEERATRSVRLASTPAN